MRGKHYISVTGGLAPGRPWRLHVRCSCGEFKLTDATIEEVRTKVRAHTGARDRGAAGRGKARHGLEWRGAEALGERR